MWLQSLDLDDDSLEAENDVKVALASVSAISIMKFIETTLFKLIWISFLDFFWSQAVAFARILRHEQSIRRVSTISSSIRMAFTAYRLSSKYSAVSRVLLAILVHTYQSVWRYFVFTLKLFSGGKSSTIRLIEKGSVPTGVPGMGESPIRREGWENFSS